jgi:hypothetical protein
VPSEGPSAHRYHWRTWWMSSSRVASS